MPALVSAPESARTIDTGGGRATVVACFEQPGPLGLRLGTGAAGEVLLAKVADTCPSAQRGLLRPGMVRWLADSQQHAAHTVHCPHLQHLGYTVWAAQHYLDKAIHNPKTPGCRHTIIEHWPAARSGNADHGSAPPF